MAFKIRHVFLLRHLKRCHNRFLPSDGIPHLEAILPLPGFPVNKTRSALPVICRLSLVYQE